MIAFYKKKKFKKKHLVQTETPVLPNSENQILNDKFVQWPTNCIYLLYGFT